MKNKLPSNLEKLRVDHPFYEKQIPGNIEGCFRIPYRYHKLLVICGCGEGWDHVSVSLKHRCPKWEEMCFIKNLFFKSDELAIQFHPPEKDYINVGKTVLHLWRPWDQEVQLPPKWMLA
ncbi:MAG: hypothetical protein JRJ39_00480 [Deltaproteobacteria bacterium]|nr:hypothetical protein [Deltaproteobacteria bacterium]MBW1845585.1 hypothetical protein [Deltaproteobacteria bacterium]MBW2032013.1 hypothetical protein [Deltaproteobacteria bacterium]